jgi:hypothetical protein
MANLRLFYPPEMAPAAADGARKKPRRPGRGKWRVYEESSVEDVPAVCQSPYWWRSHGRPKAGLSTETIATAAPRLASPGPP